MKIFKIDLVLQREDIKFCNLDNKPLFPHCDVGRTNGRKITRILILYITILDSPAISHKPQFSQNPALQVFRYHIINIRPLKNNAKE